MILSVFGQGTLFLGAFFAGFLLAFVYDIFRTLRRIIPHSRFAVHIEDIFFWIIALSAMFLFLLKLNSGETRFFSISGTFIGMAAYFYTLSPIFMKCSLYLYNLLKKTVLLLFSIISAPFKVVIYFLSYPASFVYGKIKAMYKYEKKVYNTIKVRSRNKAKKMRNNLKIVLRKH